MHSPSPATALVIASSIASAIIPPTSFSVAATRAADHHLRPLLVRSRGGERVVSGSTGTSTSFLPPRHRRRHHRDRHRNRRGDPVDRDRRFPAEIVRRPSFVISSSSSTLKLGGASGGVGAIGRMATPPGGAARSSSTSGGGNGVASGSSAGSSAAASSPPPPPASSSADDGGSIEVLRRRKQILRRHVRSRMRSAHPPPDDGTLSSESDLVFGRLFSLPQYEAAGSVGIFLSMPRGEIRTDRAISRIASSRGNAGGGGRKVLYVPRVGLDFEGRDMDMIRCDYGTATTTTTTTGDGDGDVDDGTGTGGGEASFYDGWPRNRWGIPEPPVSNAADDTAKPGDIDILVVPGLAFDAAGRRLGQGKGYYDRFIASMRGEDQDDAVVGGRGGANVGPEPAGGGAVARRRPLLVGVCLEEQFLCEVPGGVDLGGDGDGDGGIIPVSDHDYPMDIVLTPSRTLILRNVSY